MIYLFGCKTMQDICNLFEKNTSGRLQGQKCVRVLGTLPIQTQKRAEGADDERMADTRQKTSARWNCSNVCHFKGLHHYWSEQTSANSRRANINHSFRTRIKENVAKHLTSHKGRDIRLRWITGIWLSSMKTEMSAQQFSHWVHEIKYWFPHVIPWLTTVMRPLVPIFRHYNFFGER